MIDRIEQLIISDFRSVQGSISVPLNAPVVLIHGANGAGKTSVLSALELALTRDISAMRYQDASFTSYLVHKGADRATVELVAQGAPSKSSERPGWVYVQHGEIGGRAFLDQEQSQFFSERCYLAQSVLGKLLDIYQYSDTRTQSPLTRFVKDLLRLDQLDALVDGLHDAGDIRRTKNLVPEFRASEERCRLLRNRREEADQAQRAMSGDLSVRRLEFARLVTLLPKSVVGESSAPEDVQLMSNLLQRDTEQEGLVALSRYRREVAALGAAWRDLPSDLSATQRALAEDEESVASKLAQEWRDGAGRKLDSVIGSLRATFPDLPSWVSTDPNTAYQSATDRVSAEVSRVDAALKEDRASRSLLDELNSEIARAQARASLIDEQIEGLVKDADTLARALASMLPHIHSDGCPVCDRDFSELGGEPLIAHAQRKMASLTQQAGRVSALAIEKSDVLSRVSDLDQRRQRAASATLSPDARITIERRRSILETASEALKGLFEDVPTGNSRLQRLAEAQRRLAEDRERDRRATDLRIGATQLCTALGLAAASDSESVPSILERVVATIAEREAKLSAMRSERLRALALSEELLRKNGEFGQRLQVLNAVSRELEEEELKFNRAEERRLQAKAVGQAAREARTSIVRRVFNESLNRLWRELFVRLAPSEPFVPLFRLPESDVGVVAALETRHKSGELGGNPGVMLSAGNLNTAALTLFLALHLSVAPQINWLVLDDPVQSMDEVHITQFSALLRTLSRGHDRNLIIAVHDRPLFDYLSLELGPAFPGDQLITVELARSDTGETTATSNFFTFRKDEAVAA